MACVALKPGQALSADADRLLPAVPG